MLPRAETLGIPGIQTPVPPREPLITRVDVRHWTQSDARRIYNRLERKLWVPWLVTPARTLAAMTRVYPEGQHVILDNQDQPAASLSTNRIRWDGSSASLPTWDAVAGVSYDGSSVSEGDYSTTYTPDGNTIVLMTMNVAPEFQGLGLPRVLLHQVQLEADEKVEHLISPFRPNEYGKYKYERMIAGELVPSFEEYCAMTRQDGLPIDAWLRNLTRNGMQILRTQEDSMVVEVSTGEFERYRQEDWIEVIPGVWECREVGRWHRTIDDGRMSFIYREPNVWGEVPRYATS